MYITMLFIVREILKEIHLKRGKKFAKVIVELKFRSRWGDEKPHHLLSGVKGPRIAKIYRSLRTRRTALKKASQGRAGSRARACCYMIKKKLTLRRRDVSPCRDPTSSRDRETPRVRRPRSLYMHCYGIGETCASRVEGEERERRPTGSRRREQAKTNDNFYDDAGRGGAAWVRKTQRSSGTR